MALVTLIIPTQKIVNNSDNKKANKNSDTVVMEMPGIR